MNRLDAMPARFPLNGTLELTLRCNLRCKMCMFRHGDDENDFLKARELTPEQWDTLARQMQEAGVIDLLITGGEPLFREDFCEIYRRIYRYGFLITLYTNATLVDDTVMETLKELPPHKIGVTFYGASDETYESLCGV
ncbi:MAG: radical SAM protein, partial [Clostridia bacterium]|nr:radical SAM protein [Clostridia bacterium]